MSADRSCEPTTALPPRPPALAMRLGAASIAGLLGWLGYFVPLSFVGALAWIAACIALAVRLPKRYVLAVLATSPFAAGALGGFVSYARGQPTIFVAGFPEDAPNVDRTTRARHRTSDGVVSFGEWMVHTPWNVAVRAATAVLGPARGTYDGPYPTAAEARWAVQRGGTPVPLVRLLVGRVRVDGHEVPLARDLGQALLEAVHGRPASELVAHPGSARVDAALVGGRALVLRFGGRGPLGRAHVDELVVLVDARRGVPFAYYVGDRAALSAWDLPPTWSRFASYVSRPISGGVEVSVGRRRECTARAASEADALVMVHRAHPGCFDEPHPRLVVLRE